MYICEKYEISFIKEGFPQTPDDDTGWPQQHTMNNSWLQRLSAICAKWAYILVKSKIFWKKLDFETSNIR